MNDVVTVPRAFLNMQARILRMYANRLQGDHRDTCGCTACEVAREVRDDAQQLRAVAGDTSAIWECRCGQPNYASKCNACGAAQYAGLHTP